MGPDSNENRSRGRVIVVACVAAAIILSGAVYMLHGGASPGARVAKAVSANSFKQMTPQQQQQVAGPDGLVKVIDDKSLNDADREKAIQNMMQVQMRAQLDEYAALKDDAARKAYLDKMIDAQQQMMTNAAAEPATKPGERRITFNRKVNSRDMAEQLPADLQARIAQFLHDLNAERAARGLPPSKGMIVIRSVTTH